MKNVLLLCVMLISSLYAQQTNLKSAFVTANLGVYDVAQSQFDQVYNSNIGFLPGISLGLPISTRTYFYCKASYFSKDGVPEAYELELQNGKSVIVSEGREGTAKFREWLFNAGLLYNIFLSEEYTLGINGGISFVNFYEEKEGPAGSYSVISTGGGFLGFFGGVSLERNFDSSPFSIVGEVQYNLSRGDIQSFVGALQSFTSNYGGLDINLGGRFYFNERRTQ